MNHTVRSRSSGTILVAVLVCMGIAISISLTAVHTSLTERRQLTHEWQMEQTRWVADVGLVLALQKLYESPDYEGEQREVLPAIHEHCKTTIHIKIDRDETTNEPVSVLVTAAIHTTDLRPIQTQHTAEWSIP